MHLAVTRYLGFPRLSVAPIGAPILTPSRASVSKLIFREADVSDLSSWPLWYIYPSAWLISPTRNHIETYW